MMPGVLSGGPAMFGGIPGNTAGLAGGAHPFAAETTCGARKACGRRSGKKRVGREHEGAFSAGGTFLLTAPLRQGHPISAGRSSRMRR